MNKEHSRRNRLHSKKRKAKKLISTNVNNYSIVTIIVKESSGRIQNRDNSQVEDPGPDYPRG